VIVSESTARNFWPGESALGKTLRMEAQLRDGGTEMIVSSAQVIGIARDNQIYQAGLTPPSFVYIPGVSRGEIDTALLVRTSTDAAALKDSARREAYALEPVLRLSVRTFGPCRVAWRDGSGDAGVAARECRDLWSDGVVSGPTHARDRYSHGARRAGT
jgi:hypothetical protein